MNNNNSLIKKRSLPAISWGMTQFEAPLNKMGVTVSEPFTPPTDFDIPFPTEFPTQYVHLIKTNSGVKEVPIRLPAEHEIAVVDWVNFTFGIETLGQQEHANGFLTSKYSEFDPADPDDNRYVYAIDEFSERLEHIFGFGITKRFASGRNFYKQCYQLGNEQGLVHIGGQNDTILVMLNGKGCSFATEGWEKRLYTFLTNIAIRPKLTRVDLAHDDFEGKYINVDWGNMMDGLGGFNCSNKQPNVEHKGNWKRPTGKGRTLNIGVRESGKYLRIYEKGRAEGDPDDNWQRAEVEFKASDRILPFDMLLSPSEYFLGAYPCFQELSEHIQPTRIQTLKKNTSITINAAIETIKHQYGKYINFFKEFLDPEDLINLISHKESGVYPKRLDSAVLTAMRM